jgi:tetratricopeptide (TPR) repeat protein
MRRRSEIAAVTIGCCLALGGVTVVPAAASETSSATAPEQLTNAYPLGPRKLCCNGQTGVNGRTDTKPQTRSDTNAGSRPAAGIAPAHARTQPTGKPARGGSSGGPSAVLLIGFGAAAALLVTGIGAAFRTRRASLPIPAEGPGAVPAVAHANARVPAADYAGNAKSRAGPSRDRLRSGSIPASASEELEYRRFDARGDAGGAFNLGVVLHQRGDVADALAAYERAEQRGDLDAGFNLGVLRYETGDLDGAEGAWRRTAGRGHVRAAANLLFLSRIRDGSAAGGEIEPETPEFAEFEELSYRHADEAGVAGGAYNRGVILHERGDVPGATAAYARAEQWGDPDAAYNLGVLLYEAGDLGGAEAAWRRGARRGHARAAENLEFLYRRRRNEPQRAGVGGEVGS